MLQSDSTTVSAVVVFLVISLVTTLKLHKYWATIPWEVEASARQSVLPLSSVIWHAPAPLESDDTVNCGVSVGGWTLMVAVLFTPA